MRPSSLNIVSYSQNSIVHSDSIGGQKSRISKLTYKKDHPFLQLTNDYNKTAGRKFKGDDQSWLGFGDCKRTSPIPSVPFKFSSLSQGLSSLDQAKQSVLTTLS